MLTNEFDRKEKEIFTSKDYMSPLKDCPKTAVSFFSTVIEEQFIKLFNPVQIATISVGSKIPVWKFTYKGKDMVYFRSVVGAPALACMMEELSAIGIENFLIAGNCGVLDENIPGYSLILPTSAYRDEGTSFHYAEPSDEIEANLELVQKMQTYLDEKNVPYILGKTWTTDAIYRETRERAERRKAEGCVCVEMENAALNAVANFRNLNFCQVLYGADVVVEGKHEFRNLVREHRDLTKEENLLMLIVDMGKEIYD